MPEIVYKCGSCGDRVPASQDGPPFPCLKCGSDDWQEDDDDA